MRWVFYCTSEYRYRVLAELCFNNRTDQQSALNDGFPRNIQLKDSRTMMYLGEYDNNSNSNINSNTNTNINTNLSTSVNVHKKAPNEEIVAPLVARNSRFQFKKSQLFNSFFRLKIFPDWRNDRSTVDPYSNLCAIGL